MSFFLFLGHRRTISGGSFLGNIMGSPSGLFLPRGSSSIGSRAEFLQRSLDARSKCDGLFIRMRRSHSYFQVTKPVEFLFSSTFPPQFSMLSFIV